MTGFYNLQHFQRQMEMRKMTENDVNDENRSQNNDPEDQLNNNANDLGQGESGRKKLMPSLKALKINRFKNKYFKNSVHSILFIIIFLIIILINFIGIELFFSSISKFFGSQKTEPEFEIRPRILDKTLIEINHKNWKQLSDDVNNYLSQKSTKNCNSNENFYCLLVNETKNTKCSKEQTFGLISGKPCIAVDLKTVSKMLNSNTTNESSRIHLKCDGEKNVDKEAIGPLEYYPKNGVPLRYFNNETISNSPFLFINFANPQLGIVFFVECQVFTESADGMNVLAKGFNFQILVDV